MRLLIKIFAIALAAVPIGLVLFMGFFVLSMGVSFAKAGEPESIAAFGWAIPLFDFAARVPVGALGLSIASLVAVIVSGRRLRRSYLESKIDF